MNEHSFVVVLAGTLCGVAFAADVYQKTAGVAMQTDFSSPAVWEPEGKPTSGNSYWVVGANGVLFSKNNNNDTFAGGTLNIGAPSSRTDLPCGTGAGTLYSKAGANMTMTVPNLVWWNGAIHPFFGAVNAMAGTCIVRQADAGACHYHGLNSTSYNLTLAFNYESAADDIHAADAEVKLTANGASATPNCTLATAETGSQATFTISGNNSKYKGRFCVEGKFRPVILASATAIGSPDEPRTDAIRLNTDAVLAIKGDFAQNPNRGIEVYGSQAYLMTWANLCNRYTVKYPISGAGGVIVHGPGTVTLDCAYSAGAITVDSGTLILASGFTYPAGTKVTVKSGAKIVLGTNFENLDLVREAGAQTGYVTPYDPATNESTALNLTGETLVAPVEIALEKPIALPFTLTNHNTNDLALARLPMGTTLTAADFVDLTGKTYGLPKSRLEIRTGEGGVPVLYQVSTPVVTSVKEAPLDGYGADGRADCWSDGKAVHAGADYLQTGFVINNLKTAYPIWDSLTIASDAHAHLRDLNSNLRATMYPGSYINQNYSYRQHVVGGRVTLVGSFDDTTAVEFQSKYPSTNTTDHVSPQSATYAFDIVGNGLVRFTANNVESINGMKGDNTGFAGRFILTCAVGASAEYTGTRLRVWDKKNFGAALGTFRYNAFTIEKYAKIYPQQNIVLDTANRGIYVVAGGFDVPDGVRFDLREPLRVNGTFLKHGGGVLSLGGALSFGTSGTTANAATNFLVRAGAVEALCDEAVNNFNAKWSDGAEILLSSKATTVNGITGKFVPETSGAKVYVRLDTAESGFACGLSYKIPICTVAETEPDLMTVLAAGRTKGYATTVVKEKVMIGGVASVRYFGVFEKSGMLILFK